MSGVLSVLFDLLIFIFLFFSFLVVKNGLGLAQRRDGGINGGTHAVPAWALALWVGRWRA